MMVLSEHRVKPRNKDDVFDHERLVGCVIHRTELDVFLDVAGKRVIERGYISGSLDAR